MARAREQSAAHVFLLHRRWDCRILMKEHVARTSPHAAAGRPVAGPEPSSLWATSGNGGPRANELCGRPLTSLEPTSSVEAGRRRTTGGAPRATELSGGWRGNGRAGTITGATASARRNGGGRSGGALGQRPYAAQQCCVG